MINTLSFYGSWKENIQIFKRLSKIATNVNIILSPLEDWLFHKIIETEDHSITEKLVISRGRTNFMNEFLIMCNNIFRNIKSLQIDFESPLQ